MVPISSSERVGVNRGCNPHPRQNPFSLGIGLDQRDRASSSRPVSCAGNGWFRRPPGRSRRWRRIPAPYWRWWPDPRAAACRDRGRRTPRTCPPRPWRAASPPLSAPDRCRWCPLTSRPVRLKPNNLGDQHRNRLAQHRGLGLDPADAPAKHGRAVDHGGVAVGADKGVWIGHGFTRSDRSSVQTVWARYSRFT